MPNCVWRVLWAKAIHLREAAKLTLSCDVLQSLVGKGHNHLHNRCIAIASRETG